MVIVLTESALSNIINNIILEEKTEEEKIIMKYNLGKGAVVKFKNDPKTYHVKNLHNDGKSMFVTSTNGLDVRFKKIKNLVSINYRDVSI